MLEKCHHFTLTDSLVIVQKNQCLVPGPGGEGLPIKSDGWGNGGRMLSVPNFLKKYTAGCANLQKSYTAGYAVFIEKGLH